MVNHWSTLLKHQHQSIMQFLAFWLSVLDCFSSLNEQEKTEACIFSNLGTVMHLLHTFSACYCAQLVKILVEKSI